MEVPQHQNKEEIVLLHLGKRCFRSETTADPLLPSLHNIFRQKETFAWYEVEILAG